jgi:hypothetical protein
MPGQTVLDQAYPAGKGIEFAEGTVDAGSPAAFGHRDCLDGQEYQQGSGYLPAEGAGVKVMTSAEGLKPPEIDD